MSNAVAASVVVYNTVVRVCGCAETCGRLFLFIRPFSAPPPPAPALPAPSPMPFLRMLSCACMLCVFVGSVDSRVVLFYLMLIAIWFGCSCSGGGAAAAAAGIRVQVRKTLITV